MNIVRYSAVMLVVLMLFGMGTFHSFAVDDNTIAPLADEFNAPVTSLEQGVGFVINIIKWMYTLVFIIAVLFILLAAYTYTTSQGDEKKVEKAKKQIQYAVIGVAVALLSWAFVVLVTNFVLSGGEPSNTGGVPDPCPDCVEL